MCVRVRVRVRVSNTQWYVLTELAVKPDTSNVNPHKTGQTPSLFQSSFFPSLPQPAPFFLFYPHLQISPATSPLLSSDPSFGLSCGLGFCFMHSECSAEWKQTRLSDSFTLQSSKQDTHTHTHTHVGFCGLRGLSIGVMVFILYKLYVLLPYTYPTPKLSPHRRRCISIFPQKKLTLYDL